MLKHVQELWLKLSKRLNSARPAASANRTVLGITAAHLLTAHAKPLNSHSPPAPCYMYYMCYIILYAR